MFAWMDGWWMDSLKKAYTSINFTFFCIFPIFTIGFARLSYYTLVSIFHFFHVDHTIIADFLLFLTLVLLLHSLGYFCVFVDDSSCRVAASWSSDRTWESYTFSWRWDLNEFSHNWSIAIFLLLIIHLDWEWWLVEAVGGETGPMGQFIGSGYSLDDLDLYWDWFFEVVHDGGFGKFF